MPATLERVSESAPLNRFGGAPLTAMAWIVVAGLFAIPIVCAPDLMDRFDVPKESSTRAEAIVLFFLALATALYGGRARFHSILRDRPIVVTALCGLVWTAVVTGASTNRVLSISSLITIATSTVLFFAVWLAAPRISLAALDVLVPAAIINTVLAALQEYEIYNPLGVPDGISAHLSATALIGNPNIVGSYLSLVTIVLAAAATQTRGLRRAWYSLGVLTSIAGVLVSDTETAVITVLVGLVALALMRSFITRSFKRAAMIAAAIVIVIGVAAALRVSVVTELLALPQRIRREGLEVAVSGRVAPALVALQMVKERPLMGFGPGTYGFEFMPRRIQLAEESAGKISRGLGTNFGEVHNDHLHLMAEGGIPAYLLFLAIIGLIAWKAVRASADEERSKIARIIAIPAALSLLVLCLAQFPLQVAVTRHLLITLAGLAAGWSRNA